MAYDQTYMTMWWEQYNSLSSYYFNSNNDRVVRYTKQELEDLADERMQPFVDRFGPKD